MSKSVLRKPATLPAAPFKYTHSTHSLPRVTQVLPKSHCGRIRPDTVHSRWEGGQAAAPAARRTPPRPTAHPERQHLPHHTPTRRPQKTGAGKTRGRGLLTGARPITAARPQLKTARAPCQVSPLKALPSHVKTRHYATHARDPG